MVLKSKRYDVYKFIKNNALLWCVFGESHTAFLLERKQPTARQFFINALNPRIMKEFEEIFEDYDLPMIAELKESIDFAISSLHVTTSLETIQPLLLFNSVLSEWLKDITIQLEDENRFYEVIFDHWAEKKNKKKKK